MVAAHPFLVESSYTKSPDFRVSGQRRGRERERLALLLSALLRVPVTWLSSRQIGARGKDWVLLPTAESGPWECAYCRHMYVHSSIKYDLEEFTPVATLGPIPVTPAGDYYSPRRVGLEHELDLPDDLSESFDLFFALPRPQQDQFLRACYWLNQANCVDSVSLIFLAFIQAIEALAWAPRSETNCPTCGKPQGPGPTRLFNQFLDKYAPAAETGRRELYRVRSGMTHGSRPPFLVDVEIHSSFLPHEFEEREHVTDASFAAKIALHNWLRDPAPASIALSQSG